MPFWAFLTPKCQKSVKSSCAYFLSDLPFIFNLLGAGGRFLSTGVAREKWLRD
jgi:hypothetical protein